MRSSRTPVGILNTAICTQNTGDFIIMESAMPFLDDLLIDYQQLHFPTHEKLSKYGRKLQKSCLFNVACGTNLLHSHMSIVKQWNVGIKDYFSMAPTVLMGVGWRSQKKYSPDLYTRILLKKILSRKMLHSVRDSYAESQLKKAGVDNVVNTGCHTTWSLTPEHCSLIPKKKAENVVFTFTDYSPNEELDKKQLNFLLSVYEKVFVWCQGTGDFEYLKRLGYADKVTIIADSLVAYRNLLSDQNLSLDYVGTRLHGGILALQYKRRSLIIGVDHRAMEMKKDINLPVVSRYDSFSALEEKVLGENEIKINLRANEIEKWKGQFS